MSSTTGRVLITDFDGTLVKLAVDWPALRARLGVQSIGDAVTRGDPQLLHTIAAAEREGAIAGQPVEPALAFVRGFDRCAVLSDNSEIAIHAFLSGYPEIRARCEVVVGRESLGGPKSEREHFVDGLEICRRALGGGEHVVYLGDTAYELAFARELGLETIDVASLQIE
jgi:phosphoglycolate phosphatase-like HAD superfamily hydrolase